MSITHIANVIILLLSSVNIYSYVDLFYKVCIFKVKNEKLKNIEYISSKIPIGTDFLCLVQKILDPDLFF